MGKRLRDFASKLPSENMFQAVLKAYLFSKSAPSGKVRLFKSCYKDMCTKCYTPWLDGHFSMALIHPTARNVKQLLKYKGRKLSKKQDQLKQFLELKMCSVAKYTCDICSFNTRMVLKTRAMPRNLETKNAVPAEKKKKGPSKKEDKFAPKDFRAVQQMLESKILNGNSVQEKGKCIKEMRKRKHN